MNISLTPTLEKLIQQRVKSGRYQTASEVVREALRVLEERDESLNARKAELLAKIKKGIDDVNAGRVHPFDMAEIRKKGMLLLKARKKAKAK